MEENPQDPIQDHHHLSLRQLLIRTVLLLGVALLFYGLLFFFFRNQILALSNWMSEYFGLLGIFFYTLIVDTFIVPATVDFLWPVVRTWDPLPTLTVISLGSVIGGIFGYLIGRYLNHFQIVKDITASYRDYGEKLIQKYGIWAVVLASLTPIPYSTVSWIAGMLRLKPSHYFIGALFRIPRMVAYYYLVILGIDIFQGWLNLGTPTP